MLIPIDEIYLNCHYDEALLKEKIPVIFLHGFTGCISDWDFLEGKMPKQFTAVLIDLLGHGNSSSPENSKLYSENNQVKYLLKTADYLEIEKFVLVGYSMGGRLAASFAVKFPERISALVLESASFGIENEVERNVRISDDRKLAEMIENNGINDFINFWYSIPLFNTLKKIPSAKFEGLVQKRKASNNAIGLKNSLIGFSTGKMSYLISELNNIGCPVLFIAGEEDKKYADTGNKVLSEFPNSELIIVKNCGHNVHFENPEEFLKLLSSFLSNI